MTKMILSATARIRRIPSFNVNIYKNTTTSNETCVQEIRRKKLTYVQYKIYDGEK